jgi:hypothetical protein
MRLQPIDAASAKLIEIGYTADGSQAAVLIARRPNAVAFPPLPRLAAHFAGANRFQFSGFDALLDRVCGVVDIEPQAVKFLLDLQDFERAFGCFLGFRNERLQVFAQPPHDVEPAVAVGKAICHAGLTSIACDVEPRRPMLDQLLFQFSAHGGQAYSGNSI